METPCPLVLPSCWVGSPRMRMHLHSRAAIMQIYIVAGLWGIADGAWYTAIPAHLGATFSQACHYL